MREVLAAVITAGVVGWIVAWVWAGRHHPEMIRRYLLRPTEAFFNGVVRYGGWVLIGGLIIVGVLGLYVAVYALISG